MRKVQLILSILLLLSGIVLLFCGFWVDPEGEIHSSVLVAFGEISTFAGGLFGVDYCYSVRLSESKINPSQKQEVKTPPDLP